MSVPAADTQHMTVSLGCRKRLNKEARDLGYAATLKSRTRLLGCLVPAWVAGFAARLQDQLRQGLDDLVQRLLRVIIPRERLHQWPYTIFHT